MIKFLKYEKLVDDFNHQLVDKLRLHGSGNEALSLWVPDENISKSFQNLISALKETKVENFKISFLRSAISDDNIDEIMMIYEDKLDLSFKVDKDRVLFIINNIQDSTFKGNKLKEGQAQELVVNVDYKYGDVYLKKIPKEFTAILKSYSTKDTFNQAIVDKSKDYYLSVNDDQIEIAIVFNIKELEIINFEYNFKRNPVNYNVKAICEMIGEVGIGLPVKEFCEHIILKVIHKFVKLSPPFKKPAIILPNNIGPEFMYVNKLIHSLYRKVNDTKIDKIFKNINFYDNPPKEQWLKLSENLKNVEIKKSIKEFELSNHINQGAIDFKEITNDLDGWPIRVTISFSNEIEIKDRPKILRNLETHVRFNVENTMQIFYEESKDKSKIRRL